MPSRSSLFQSANITSTLLIAGLLSGCAAVTPPQTAEPTPSETAPMVQSMTPDEAKAAFEVIAKASCFAAQEFGVVETSDDFTVIAVSKNDSYLNYSAAFRQAPDSYGLVWELDAIFACADYYEFSMAEEAGQASAVTVTFDPVDSTFTTFRDYGELGSAEIKFRIEDQKFATAESLETEEPTVTTIRYGGITEADLEILITAVDEFLAKS